MEFEKLNALILHSIEHERGGARVYESAIQCALNEDLRDGWTAHLDQARRHLSTLERVCEVLQLDPDEPSPGRDVVRTFGAALLAAMSEASSTGDPIAAQRVASECVTLAETKDFLDWERAGRASDSSAGPLERALRRAFAAIESRIAEPYHTKGDCRELWMEALGLHAIAPSEGA